MAAIGLPLLPTIGWTQALGAACTGSGITSPVADGGLLRCNGSTYVPATIYAGNIGVGTSTPYAMIDIYGSANSGQSVRNYNSSNGSAASVNFTLQNDTSQLAIALASSNNNNGYALFETITPGDLYFRKTNNSGDIYFTTTTNYTPRLTIKNGGNIGISNTNPSYVLDVGGATRVVGSNTCIIGNTATITCTSDRRLKTDIQPIPDALAKLSQITGVTYHWKDPAKAGRQQLGVIAQDVEKVFPEAVAEISDTRLGTAKAVDYAVLVAPLIEAVKQLKAENETLRREVEDDHKRAALDHDLLFKVRQKVLLPEWQMTPYTESAWQYAPQPKGWKPHH